MTDLIAEYEQHLRRKRRAQTTIEGYIGILRRMDRDITVGLAAACTDEIEDWIFNSDRQRSETTCGHYITIVRGFGKWVTDPKHPRLDFDATEELPEVDGEYEKEVRPVTEDELADVLARAAAPFLDFFILAAFLGLRCIEIAGIRREHIGERETRIFGKGSKWRRVPTPPIVWERYAGHPAGPLLLNRRGEPFTRSAVVAAGNGHVKRIGFMDLSMHCFRKRYGTMVYELSGRDIRVAQNLLGHASVTTTMRYVGVNKDRQAAAVAGLPVPDGARR